MANQLKGSAAAMSKFNVSKRTLQNYELRQTLLLESIARDTAELAELPPKIEAAKRAHAVEVAKVQAEEVSALSGELRELTTAMDEGGVTPEREGRLHQILSAGRLARLVGQSYEMERLMIARIKSPTGRDHKTRWATFNGWLRPPQSSQAA